MSISLHLKRWGLTTISAPTLQEVVPWSFSEPPAVVFISEQAPSPSAVALQVSKLFQGAKLIYTGFWKTGAAQPFLSTPVTSSSLSRVLKLTLLPPSSWTLTEEAPLPPIDYKILIVEDNKVDAMIIQSMLKSLSCSAVEMADNGKEALEKLEAKEYSVLFCDLHMAGVSTTEVVRILRSRKGSQPHIIAVSASSQPEVRADSASAGMCSFLLKPLSTKTLRPELQLQNCRVCNSRKDDGEEVAKAANQILGTKRGNEGAGFSSPSRTKRERAGSE
jgi:CheY-like chemotaxis protein